MRKNSKKRVLLSSVAMLMVAAVSLGSATYAWFTASTSVTAEGINVRTSKTSKLEISDDSRAYSSSGFVYEGFKNVMVPSSSYTGLDWFTGSAVSSVSYASNGKFTKITDNTTSYVYKDQLNIKNAGEVNIKNIEIEMVNLPAADTCGYLRVALVPVAAKVDGGDLTMKQADFRDNIYGQTTAGVNATYKPVMSESVISEAPFTPKQNTKITVSGELAPNAELHYNLFVWFEGQDAKCLDANTGQGVSNLSFKVTGTPVTA